MDVQERNSTRIYDLSSGPNLPEWIGERARRNLSKRDASIRRRIDLLQDFAMPTSSSKLMMSNDGRFVMGAGTYSPRIRCFDVSELSMKFERYVDAEVVDMLFLGEDYGKFAVLQNNRSVQFHANYGQHTSLRIPTFGRALAYEPTTCELLVACSGKAGRNSVSKTLGGGEVYRINLEEGRFSSPLTYRTKSNLPNDESGSVAAPVVGGSCIAVSPAHALTALGGSDGVVRFWDNRTSPSTGPDDINLKPFCGLDVKSSTAGFGFYDESNMLLNVNPGEVTSLAFDRAGMHIVAGTFGGCVALYDVRSSKPLHVKEHQYGIPIHTVRFHSGSGTILSCDAKLVKAWSDGRTGKVGSIVTNIEGSTNFTHFIAAGDEKDPTGNQSGLILCAGEQPKMQAFYCPALGSAPRWCSFLDSITEELEERDLGSHREGVSSSSDLLPVDGASSGIYEDYKFLTRSEIDELGIQNLVGTPLLRGYMHGFFVDIGLYNRIRSVAKPFEYEEYRKKKIREKMEEKRASRIAPKKMKKQPKVNKELAQRLESKASIGGKGTSTKLAKSLIEDHRFGLLFSDPNYEIDEEDINFKLRNPSGVTSKRADKDDMDSDEDDNGSELNTQGEFKRVSDNDDDGWEENESESDIYDTDSDEDGFRGAKVRGENYEEMKVLEKKLEYFGNKGERKKKIKKVMMYEADDYNGSSNSALKIGLGSATSSRESKIRREEVEMSLEERLKRLKDQSNDINEAKNLEVKGDSRTKEVVYVPNDTKKKMEAEEEKKRQGGRDDEQRKRKRRGIKGGVKNPFQNKIS